MKAFLKANWLNLLAAAPAGIAAHVVYGAIAALGTPRPSSDSDATYSALKAYEHATRSAAVDIGWLVFWGVLALVVWRWRTRLRITIN